MLKKIIATALLLQSCNALAGFEPVDIQCFDENTQQYYTQDLGLSLTRVKVASSNESFRARQVYLMDFTLYKELEKLCFEKYQNDPKIHVLRKQKNGKEKTIPILFIENAYQKD